MSFKEEDKVRGKAGTQFEFAELEVISIDTTNRMVLIEVTSHEYDPEQVGDQEWVGVEDLEYIGSPSPSYMKSGAPTATVRSVAPPSSQMETLLILGEI